MDNYERFQARLRNYGNMEPQVIIAATGEVVDMLHLESCGDLWYGSPMDARREVYLVGFDVQSAVWVAFSRQHDRCASDTEQQIKAWYLKQRRRR